MSDAIEILEELESIGSRLAKEAILEREIDNSLLKNIFSVTGDPYIDYGVRKFKLPAPTQNFFDFHVVEDFVYNALPSLASREITGNAARQLVEEKFSRMSQLEQKWCQRILLKNLRCGVSEKTVNKLWPGTIKKFEVMLAMKVEQANDGSLVDVKYPVRVEPKLDGLRLVCMKRNGTVLMFTRNGNQVDTLPSIKEALEKHPNDNFVLDSECMGESWNESNSVMMSTKRTKDDKNMYLNVFDIMSADEWDNKNSKPMGSRVIEITQFMSQLPTGSPIRQVQGITAMCESEIKEFYAKCLDDAYEGVMLKDLDAQYEFKRSNYILKYKPVATFEGAVVGWYEGIVGRKREGLFAGFNVLMPNGIVTRVGNGFSDALKKEINDIGPDTYFGTIVEVEGQPDVTKDGLTKDGKVRFPVLLRTRDASDVDPKVLEALENWVEENK